MPYLTPTQFTQCYDIRRIAELLSDSGTPVSEGSISGNAIIIELINQATSMVNTAVRVGNRYLPSDLDTLASDTENGGVLRRLVADITWGLLVKRRGLSSGEISSFAPGYDEAMQQLELLRLGERIFDIGNADLAGLPSVTGIGLNAPGQMISKTRFFGCTGANENARTFGDRGCC